MYISETGWNLHTYEQEVWRLLFVHPNNVVMTALSSYSPDLLPVGEMWQLDETVSIEVEIQWSFGAGHAFPMKLILGIPASRVRVIQRGYWWRGLWEMSAVTVGVDKNTYQLLLSPWTTLLTFTLWRVPMHSSSPSVMYKLPGPDHLDPPFHRRSCHHNVPHRASFWGMPTVIIMTVIASTALLSFIS